MGCRRHIKGVLLFAMLGVIANLAVAWMFAYSTLAPYSTLNAPLLSPTRIERWPVPVPDHWPGNAAIVDRWVNSGFERREMTASARTIETSTTPAAITTYSMSITLAGWPLTAFAAARLETLQQSTNAASPIQQNVACLGHRDRAGTIARLRRIDAGPVSAVSGVAGLPCEHTPLRADAVAVVGTARRPDPPASPAAYGMLHEMWLRPARHRP